jgi:hypothetical protein
VATVPAYFLSTTLFYSYAEIAVVVFAFELSPHLAKHFGSPRPAMFAITALIIYTGTLTIGAYRSIHKIETDLAQAGNASEIVLLAAPPPLRSESLVLIGANSSYFFFVDRTNQTGVVIPKDKANAVTTVAKDRSAATHAPKYSDELDY